jgi:hypothetical protein
MTEKFTSPNNEAFTRLNLPNWAINAAILKAIAHHVADIKEHADDPNHPDFKTIFSHIEHIRQIIGEDGPAGATVRLDDP